MKLKIKLDINSLLSKRYRTRMLLNNPIVCDLIKQAYRAGGMNKWHELLCKTKPVSQEEYLQELKKRC